MTTTHSHPFASIVKQYLPLAPVWIDFEDLMQDGWVAVLEGRLFRYGVLDAVLKNGQFVRVMHTGLSTYHLRCVSIALTPERWAVLSAPTPPESDLFLRKRIAALPTRQRQVLGLLLMDYTQAEIARQLHLTDAAISLSRRAALATLRQQMQEVTV